MTEQGQAGHPSGACTVVCTLGSCHPCREAVVAATGRRSKQGCLGWRVACRGRRKRSAACCCSGSSSRRMAMAAAHFFQVGHNSTGQVAGDGSNPCCYHCSEEKQGETETTMCKWIRKERKKNAYIKVIPSKFSCSGFFFFLYHSYTG